MGSHPGDRGRSGVPDALAAIDIGTNSIHMVVARVADPDASRFEVITRFKEMVRLGSGRGEMKELEPDAVERGVVALARCRALAESFSAPVHAVATSAVREARNAQVFIERARSEAGVEVAVISGVEEARLIQLGVLQALPVFDRRLVLVDVGGGSTEVLVGRGDAVDGARSVKLGSLRMTRKFFPGGVVRGDAVQRCRRHVAAKLAPVAHELGPLGHEVAVASSGTAETLAAMAFARKGGEVPQSLNGATLTRRALGKVVEDLAAARTPEERRRLPGMEAARADILLGGAIVLEQVCDALGIAELTVSEYALREGVLLDALHRLRGGTLHHLSDLRRASVFHLMELCDDDPTHSVHVSRLALQLHDHLSARLGLDEADRELLEAAALLCHVGLFVAHSAHHKHSYYVIRSTEHLMGFTDAEIEVIAQVARYHRKSPPSSAKHPEFAALGEADRHRVAAMAALLRIAIALDRNHEQAVERVDVTADRDGPGLVLVLHGTDGADLSLERWSAADAASVLAALLGTGVSVVEAASRPAG
jgi:exopolyphosphatase/guanosine-5'-triphosphate,3'-diphosphate pyrophosphatase